MASILQGRMAQLNALKGKIISQLTKGENFELKTELNSEYRERRREAVRRVIANMTVGKDVSALFPDVIKNMHTEDLETKKLIYLYLINYAKSKPNLVILAVNTFIRDSDDSNPLLRALAIRTMGCLQVEEILDYIVDPLRKGLSDDSPYVRKTAVLCVAKLYELNAEVCIENGFVDAVRDLLSDANPMVISNAVAALCEIGMFAMEPVLLGKLLVALNECNEWSQITLLDALAGYAPANEKEAESICERVLPRLAHANGAVVLSAIRVLLHHSKHVGNEQLVQTYMKKMTPPLVTLLASSHEVQYVALRNINLILQQYPDLLGKDLRVFYCKYNDPIYVKYEKLSILVKICGENNSSQLLNELKEYANEVDVDFARRSIRAMGLVAVKASTAAERTVAILLELIGNHHNHTIQEAMTVMKDIFRKYPNKFDNVIPTLCQSLDSLDEPDAKASFIWIMGEYADKIENADQILSAFVDQFKIESTTVQLQLLTATVKLFLRKADKGKDLVLRTLQTAAQEGDSADVRDRAYVYWRLLSASPQQTGAVVLADKPPIRVDTAALPEQLLEDLVEELGSVASVYHKPPAMFGGNAASSTNTNSSNGTASSDIIAFRSDSEGASDEVAQAAAASSVQNDLFDLTGLGSPAVTTTTATATTTAAQTTTGQLQIDSPVSSAAAENGNLLIDLL
ncbi:Adaptor protein complex beta subunit [Ramicandelaber brevisporus]|nr:Adaptor protein complex beta subunit [Ramicandelaber brevisporus]